MNRQLRGIALILFSLLLSHSFKTMEIKNVFDLNISWQLIFILVACVGVVLVFTNSKQK